MVELVTGTPHHGKTAQSGGANASYHRQKTNDRMAGSVPVWANNAPDCAAAPLSLNEPNPPPNAKAKAPSLSFGEVLDIINPLHHLPIVGGIYRQITGDTISPVARIAGGTLFGGPIGAAVALANAAVEEHSGQDIAGNVMSAFNAVSTPRKSNPHIAYGQIWEDTRMAGSMSPPKTAIQPAEQQDDPTHDIAHKDDDIKLAESIAASGQIWKFNS